MNISPCLNEYPFLDISNEDTSNVSDAIPVVEAALTAKSTKRLFPVSDVGPTDNLDIPSTVRLSYLGSETYISGFE